MLPFQSLRRSLTEERMPGAQDDARPSSSDGPSVPKRTPTSDGGRESPAVPDAVTSKAFVRRSTATCGLLVILLCSVGLLVAFLKGQKQQGRPPETTTSPSTTISVPWSLPSTTREPKRNFRLPDYILPLSYDLTLEPHFDRDTFDGDVCITVNATKPTEKFFVHVFRLTVIESQVFDHMGPLHAGKTEIDDLNEFLVVPVTAVEGAPCLLAFIGSGSDFEDPLLLV